MPLNLTEKITYLTEEPIVQREVKLEDERN